MTDVIGTTPETIQSLTQEIEQLRAAERDQTRSHRAITHGLERRIRELIHERDHWKRIAEDRAGAANRSLFRARAAEDLLKEVRDEARLPPGRTRSRWVRISSNLWHRITNSYPKRY